MTTTTTAPEAGSGEQHPLHIYNVMCLHANQSLWVTCGSKLTVQYKKGPELQVSCQISPTELTSSKRATLIPGGVVGPDFSKCWSRLPDELKEKILRYGVVKHGPVRPRCRETTELMHRLRSTPEIAKLSQHLYYRENRFKVILSFINGRATPHQLSVLYPNPNVGGMIRKLQVDFKEDMIDHAHTLLHRLATAHYGMINLKGLSVKIALGTSLELDLDEALFEFDWIQPFMDRVFPNDIVMPCDGALMVHEMGGNPQPFLANELGVTQDEIDCLKNLIVGTVTFTGPLPTYF